MTPAAALFLALAVPAAPAPKADKVLPKELIDLIPEDTAAVLVLDVPRVARSGVGKAVFKAMTAEQDADDPIHMAELVNDAELVVAAQFLIDEGLGDFCFLIRLKDGSKIPKTLIDRAPKAGKDTTPEKFGKRTVYSLEGAGASFAVIDDRTLMLVLASGNEKQVKETRAAAYAERENPGPRPHLRKMLVDDAKDTRAVRLYGQHPTKLGLSTTLVLAAFGVRDDSFKTVGEKVMSYRGGIKEGDTAEIELRFTMKDADAAKEFLTAFEAETGGDRFVHELRASGKAVRDGDDVVITAKLTPGMLDLVTTKPNK